MAFRLWLARKGNKPSLKKRRPRPSFDFTSFAMIAVANLE